MVCIAAFIVLGIIVLCLPVLRIFNKDAANKIWSMFKNATACVGKRVTFQKCEVGFKDQVKNSMLKKVVLKHPTWVKPLGVAIEVLSVIIIIATIWSLLVGAKSLTALAAYGTCDIQTPEACLVGDAEACYAGEAKTAENPIEWTGNWFVEWGEAFAYLPIKFGTRDAGSYLPGGWPYRDSYDASKSVALDIFDPGCKFCRESYANQLGSGFFESHNAALLPYALRDGDEFRFANSDLIVRYIFATRMVPGVTTDGPRVEWRIIGCLFTENSPRQIVWQEDFNNTLSDVEAREVLNSWLKDFGYTDNDVVEITTLVDSDEIREQVNAARDIVENNVHIVKIPTMIIGNQRHEGVFKP
ncbi:hypothetical protein FACS189431_4790 [Alphaproteobacteria bacterium]|nr:hypothetical protein FACS189431_4790 [Alphaproteobacteria bacterium]